MMQEFVQQMTDTCRDVVNGVHTAFPGKILSFDPGKGTATVLPSMKYRKPDGSVMDYPQITGVPVVFQQGGGQNASVVFPVKAGDGCLVVIAEDSIDYWQYGQETATELKYDLTNAICIPGLYATANPMVKRACAENAVIASASGTNVIIQSGRVLIEADEVRITGKLKVDGLIQSDVDAVAQGKSLVLHKHNSPHGQTSAPI